MSPKQAVWLIVGLWVLAAIIAFKAGPPSPPPEWLKGWTTLLASVVTGALALRVLWVAPELLRDYIDKKKV